MKFCISINQLKFFQMIVNHLEEFQTNLMKRIQSRPEKHLDFWLFLLAESVKSYRFLFILSHRLIKLCVVFLPPVVGF